MRSPIDGSAIRRLLEASRTMDPVARHVLLDGLAFRVLSSEDDDASAVALKNALVPILQECVQDDKGLGSNSVTRSSAWCYLAALGQRSHLPGWPVLNTKQSKIDAQNMVAPANASDELDLQHRSLQLAFLEVWSRAFESVARAISVAHYMYIVTACWAAGRHIAEVDSVIHEAYAADAPLGKCILSYGAVPEVAAVYRECLALYEGRSV
jgi:hypothetical protein